MWNPIEIKIVKRCHQPLWSKRDMSANDRRNMVKEVCGSWMIDHKLKLGRDYKTEIKQTHRLASHDILIITIKDSKLAALFKLTWG